MTRARTCRRSHGGALRNVRRALVLAAVLAAAPGVIRARGTEVAALWREWAVLNAEWNTERAVYRRDRQRNQDLRAARAVRHAPAAPTPAAGDAR